MAPASLVIATFRKLTFHFVTLSEHMSKRFVLPFFVALAVMNLPVTSSDLETQQVGGCGGEQVETSNNHTSDQHHDDSLLKRLDGLKTSRKPGFSKKNKTPLLMVTKLALTDMWNHFFEIFLRSEISARKNTAFLFLHQN